MSNQFRILLLKIAASFAALMAGGCNMPHPINVTPQPVTPTKPQEITLTIKVEDGKITVNDAKIDVNVAQEKTAPTALFETRYRTKVVGCVNGKCQTIREAYQVPITGSLKATSGGIRVYLQPDYLNSNNASLAMRKAVGEASGIEWLYGQPPAIGNQRHWPTAVRADGTTWSCPQGWDGASLKAFQEFAK